jgi:cytochrome c oxidase subunit 3
LSMMFAGLTSGYVVSRTSQIVEGDWLEFALPKIFYASTVIVVLISLLLHFALVSIKNDKVGRSKLFLSSATVLGMLFVVFQLMGWNELRDAGIYFTGEGSNTAGSWVYVITLLHLLHLIAGVIVLIVTFIKSNLGHYNSQEFLGIDLCATYWHFVDVLWVFLFIFLSIYR